MTQNSWNSQYPAQVAVGGTGSQSFTAYSLIVANSTSTGALQSVGTGTSGQILQSQGNTGPAQWINNTNGYVLIQTQSASSSSTISFTSGISDTYNNYLLYISNVVMSVNNAYITLQLSSNGGSSYIASSYLSGDAAIQYNSTTFGNSNSTTFFYATQGTSNTAATGSNSVLNLLNFRKSAYPQVNGMNVIPSSFLGLLFGVLQSATNVNAFQLAASSGNITTGQFSLYGVVQ